MSNADRIIRNARLAERKRRNNPWSEPAYAPEGRTDAQILAGEPDRPIVVEPRRKRIQRQNTETLLLAKIDKALEQ